MSDLFGYKEALLTHELSTAFTFGGATYYGVPGHLSETEEVDFGGNALDVDKVLVCEITQFSGSPPTAQEEITIDADVLRIQSVDTAPDGAFIVLGLKCESRGV